MSNGLTFNIFGVDVSASKSLKKVGDEAEHSGSRVGSAFKTAGKVAVAGLGVGLAAMFKTGIGEQSDFLAGQAQLANGIKTTGGAAHVSVDQLENLASSIQNYSGQTDDSIVASEKLLLTFTSIKNSAGKNNDIFTQATKISADMAAKMGGDASKSAILLGKALNDPTKGLSALSRVGVSFTAGQAKQIKAMQASGNTMGAQKVIIGELNKEFGGSAKAAGQTLPGQMARAKRSFEDVSQSVVAALMPVLVALGNLLTKTIIPAFQKVVAWVIKNKSWLVPLAAVIATIVVAWKAWTIAQAALNLVMDANPIGLILVAIAALGVALVLAWKKSETFRDILKGVWNVIKVALQAAWTVIKAIFNAWLTSWKLTIDGIKAIWNNVLKPVYEAIKTGISAVKDAVHTAASAVSKSFVALGNGATWVRDHVLKPVYQFIKDGVNTVKSVVHSVASAVSQSFVALGNGAIWVRDHVLKPVYQFIKDGINGVKNVVHGAAGAVSQSFVALGNGASWVWNHVISPVFSYIKTGIGAVKKFIGPVVTAISNVFKKIGDGLAWAWSHTIGPIFGWIQKALQDIKDAYDWLTGGAGVNVSKGGVTVTDKSGKKHTVVPGHAQGTGFFAGGKTLVGERGPEVVTLPRGSGITTNTASMSQARMGGGGQTVNVTVNVNGAMATDKDLQRGVIAALENAVGGGASVKILKGLK